MTLKNLVSAPFLDASGNKNIGATIRIGQEIQCLPYAGFFSSVPLCSFSFSERYFTTMRGVHSPSFQGQLISFHLGALDLTKKKGQHDCNEIEKTPL